MITRQLQVTSEIVYTFANVVGVRFGDSCEYPGAFLFTAAPVALKTTTNVLYVPER